jgi:hypothetical protein
MTIYYNKTMHLKYLFKKIYPNNKSHDSTRICQVPLVVQRVYKFAWYVYYLTLFNMRAIRHVQKELHERHKTKDVFCFHGLDALL